MRFYPQRYQSRLILRDKRHNATVQFLDPRQTPNVSIRVHHDDGLTLTCRAALVEHARYATCAISAIEVNNYGQVTHLEPLSLFARAKHAHNRASSYSSSLTLTLQCMSSPVNGHLQNRHEPPASAFLAGPRQAGRVGIGTSWWLWLVRVPAPSRGMHLDRFAQPPRRPAPTRPTTMA